MWSRGGHSPIIVVMLPSICTHSFALLSSSRWLNGRTRTATLSESSPLEARSFFFGFPLYFHAEVTEVVGDRGVGIVGRGKT